MWLEKGCGINKIMNVAFEIIVTAIFSYLHNGMTMLDHEGHKSTKVIPHPRTLDVATPIAPPHHNGTALLQQDGQVGPLLGEAEFRVGARLADKA